MENNRNENGRRMMTKIHLGHTLRRAVGIPALGLAAVLAGCDLDELIEVDPVDQVPVEGLIEPGNAELLVNGAIADFECAYGAYVALSGVVAGELVDATQTASRWHAERRVLSSSVNQEQYGTFETCQALGLYIPLSKARWSAENILDALESWTDAELAEFDFDRQDLIAKAAVYTGYSYALLGEGFCSMAIDLSDEKQPEEMFQRAIDNFTTALTAAEAAANTDIANMSRVGRARAYLNLGQGADAAADARAVPAGFEYVAETQADFTERNNRIFAQSGPDPVGGNALSVGPQYVEHQHFGSADPRVPVSELIRTTADGTDLYWQLKYEGLDDPLPLATYDEAQLIIAEVERGSTAVDVINAFHDAAGLPPFASSDDAAILEHVIEERRAELWLEGHRFNDIERFDLPLDPAPGAPYRKGLTYGDARCFPLPDLEIRNNPNI